MSWLPPGTPNAQEPAVFFVVFLAAIGDHPELTALGAALASAAYLVLLYHGPLWDPAILLRIPFLFVTALAYGYMAVKAREARVRVKAVEDILDTMSNEARMPLQHILRYGELLNASQLGSLSPAQREGVARINAQAADLLSIIAGRMSDVLDGDESRRDEPQVTDLLRAAAVRGRSDVTAG